MALYTMLFAASLALAWLAWVVLLGGTAAVTKELNDSEDAASGTGDIDVSDFLRRRLQQFSAIEDGLTAQTALSWTIVWMLFLLLVGAVAALLMGRNNARAFKKAAHGLLFFLAVILGWMGPEAHSIAVQEKQLRDAKGSYPDALAASLAGYILMFLALFGLGTACLLAVVQDAPSPHGAQADAYVGQAHKAPEVHGTPGNAV